MSRSHVPFAVLNRTVNPLVRALLRSPAHGLLSGRVALISVTGRRSGRTLTFPVQYRRQDRHVTITVGAPARKRWWRNLRDEAPVELLLRGRRLRGRARAHGDDQAVVRVEVELEDDAVPPVRPERQRARHPGHA